MYIFQICVTNLIIVSKWLAREGNALALAVTSAAPATILLISFSTFLQIVDQVSSLNYLGGGYMV